MISVLSIVAGAFAFFIGIAMEFSVNLCRSHFSIPLADSARTRPGTTVL